jgi:hypothetical protein
VPRRPPSEGEGRRHEDFNGDQERSGQAAPRAMPNPGSGCSPHHTVTRTDRCPLKQKR